MFTCHQCSKDFKPKRTGLKPKFCSTDCFKQSIKRQTRECGHCKQLTTNPLYCSSSCSTTATNIKSPKRSKAKTGRTCEVCGRTDISNKRFCNLTCQKNRITDAERIKINKGRSREAYARYMARKKFQTPADEDLKALQEFYANTPEGYEVDHIIPLSKGGLHSLSNLQYLTQSENRKKSAKILAPVVGVEPTPLDLETSVLP